MERVGRVGSRPFPARADLPIFVSAAGSGGLSRSALRWQVSSGRWQRLHPGVYVTHSGPVDWPTRAVGAWLALLRPPTRTGAAGSAHIAGFAGWSAAYLDGLTAQPPAVITLVVPHSRYPTTPAGCRLLRSDVQQIRGDLWPPRTSVESTIVLLAAGEDLDTVMALIGRALQQGRTTLPRLAGELARWSRHPRRGVLGGLLRSDVEGTESALELRWVREVERPHGIPAATRQVREVISGVGRRHDLEYAEAHLRVELDGFLFHDRARARIDRAKTNATVAGGAAQLRYGWQEVVSQSCATAEELIRVATARGARWPARPCRRPGCAVAGSAGIGQRTGRWDDQVTAG